MDSPGKKLIELCRGTSKEVMLVAPFIKIAALSKLLQSLPNELISVRCVTRWHPEEILAGVSDLEVFDLFEGRPERKLLSIHISTQNIFAQRISVLLVQQI